MKTLRRMFAVTILSLTLAVSALAGTNVCVAGDVHCPGVASTGTTTDTITTAVLLVVTVIY